MEESVVHLARRGQGGKPWQKEFELADFGGSFAIKLELILPRLVPDRTTSPLVALLFPKTNT